jgi:hypothetical protein
MLLNLGRKAEESEIHLSGLNSNESFLTSLLSNEIRDGVMEAYLYGRLQNSPTSTIAAIGDLGVPR